MAESKNLKETIIEAAWDLFYEKGYEQTTINDIITRAGVAKGSFYYYFHGKDTLLDTLSNILDSQYKKIEPEIMKIDNCFDRLMEMNYQMHCYIGQKVNYQLIASLYAAQLTNENGSSLLDQNRYYFQMLTRIVAEGQTKGDITREKSLAQIVHMYGVCERALVTDWCMNKGSYNLGEFSREYMPLLFAKFRGENNPQ
ncbi:MAG: TetR/AcrR family transcriptional regulator [Eubacterium sp.]